jgi:hypothetical protein
MKFFLFGLVALATLTALYFNRDRLMTGSTDHSTSTRKVTDIYTIGITLNVNTEQLLFLLLSMDGSINRQGSGNFKNKNPDLFIGKTDPAIFKSVRSHLTDDMLQAGEQNGLLGHAFQFNDQRGASCKLEVRFFSKDGTSAGSFTFLYGSESQGPPHFLTDLVRVAVHETEPWYQQQLKMVSGSN